MEVESLYQEIILDHYRHPHNKGLREPYDAEVHHVNPLCGDEVTLRVTIKDAGAEPVTPRGRRKGDPLVSTSHVEPAAPRKAATLPFFPEAEPSMRMGRPRADTVTGVHDDVLPVAPSVPAPSCSPQAVVPPGPYHDATTW